MDGKLSLKKVVVRSRKPFKFW